MIRRFALFALVVAAFAATSLTAADARDRVAVGTLKCHSDGKVSLIFSSDDYRCVFHSVDGGSYRYTCLINRVGLTAGVTHDETLVWRVWAPSTSVDRKALRGSYVGASAGATVVVGLGANGLIGGSDKTISLQPLSVEANTGLNVALTATSLRLR